MDIIFEQVLFYFYENPIWQLVWIIAFIVHIFASFIKNEKKFLIFFAFVSFLWWLHYHLMWYLSWAFVNYFEIFATLFVFRYKKNLKVFLFFCFSYLVIWYFTIDWSEYFTIIPIFNAIITSYLSFFHTWFKLRIWICLTFIVRIVYSVSSHSIWWVTSDVVLFISWAIWAIKIKKEEILLKKKVDN